MGCQIYMSREDAGGVVSRKQEEIRCERETANGEREK